VNAPALPSENGLGIESRQVDGVEVVQFHNAKILSENSVRELGDRMMATVDGLPDPPRLAINFDGVNFLSSAAIGKLILVQRKLKSRSGALRLCGLSPTSYDVFRVANLHDYFAISPDVPSAVSSLSDE
jgi:anti-anti-sigma factor